MDLPSSEKRSAQPGSGQQQPPEVPGHALVRLIVSSSYGDVWLARNIMGTWRAIKIIYRNRFEDSRPFEREFEGIRRFEPISRTHEGLVDILQMGQTADATCFYYAMELADDANAERPMLNDELSAKAAGANPHSSVEIRNSESYTPRTLRSDIKRRGRLPVDECVRLGLALTEALECLHQHKLVHRDVKPSNIIFVNGVLKLADIGLVTQADQAQSLVGTDGFIPPEGPGTAQGDLYSLGKVLYEAATGKDRLKFPEPLSNVDANAELAELNHVILKACHSDPQRRYASAALMREDLLVLQSGKSLRRLHQLERRRARAARLGVAALLLLLLTTAGWLVQRHQSRRLIRLADESRHRLMRLHVANGLQAMGEGDFFSALPWFVEAMKLAKTPDEAWPHRYRIEALLRQCPRLVALGLHDGAVNSAEFSPDGRRLVSTSDDGTARVWDAMTGEPLTPPLVHGRPVNEGRFSPDGGKVVTAGEDGTARVWDATTAKALLPSLAHATNVSQASFSPDGQWILTASDDHTARIWETATGRPVGTPMTHEKEVNHAAFSPDGRLVVTASHDATAQIWRASDGTRAVAPLHHSNKVRWASFSPNGRRVATISDDGTARVWQTDTGQAVTEPIFHGLEGWYVAFSPDGGTLLTCGGDKRNKSGEARVWDATSGQPISPPLRHAARIKHGSFSLDGRWVATASHDGMARLWETDSGKPIGPPLKHHHIAWSAAFSPEGRHLLTAGREGVWRLWDLNVIEWFNPPGPFRVAPRWQPVAFDGERVVADTTNGVVKTWTLSSAMPERPPLVHSTKLCSVRISREGQYILTGSADGKVRIWNADSGTMTVPPMAHADKVYCVAFSLDGHLAASGSEDRTARIWDAASGAARTPPLPHDGPVWWVEFSPDGQLLVTCSSQTGQPIGMGEGAVRVWQVQKGQPMTPPLRHGGAFTRAVFSPDSRLVMAGCDSGSIKLSDAHIWDARTGEPVCPPLKHSGGVAWVAFSPDGHLVATASSDGSARAWDASSGQPLTGLVKHSRGAVATVCFSPDGRRLLTAGEDGTARIWDVVTGDPLGPPLKHTEPLNFAAFSPDGQKLITREWHTWALRVWQCPTENGSAERLEQIVRVVSGAYIDPTTGLTPLTPHQLDTAWQRLYSSHSVTTVSPGDHDRAPHQPESP